MKELDRVLLNKMALIAKLRDQLLNFHKNLKTEEKMSALYLQMQQDRPDFSTDATKEIGAYDV